MYLHPDACSVLSADYPRSISVLSAYYQRIINGVSVYYQIVLRQMHDVQEVIWTLICMSDDDPLCRAALRAAGALQVLVLMMGSLSSSCHISALMGLSALAARALRGLADTSSPEEDSELCDAQIQACQVSKVQQSSCLSQLAHEAGQDWASTSVPFLVRQLQATDASGKGKERLARSTSTSWQNWGESMTHV